MVFNIRDILMFLDVVTLSSFFESHVEEIVVLLGFEVSE